MATEKSLTLTQSNVSGLWLCPESLARLGRGESDTDAKHLASRWLQVKRNSTRRGLIKDIKGTDGVYMRFDAIKDKTVGYWTGNIFTIENYQLYGNPDKEDYAIDIHYQGQQYVIDPDKSNIVQFINDGCIDVKAKNKKTSKQRKRTSIQEIHPKNVKS